MAEEMPASVPTESGVEQSVLRWLRDLSGPHKWSVYGFESGEGAAALDREYGRGKGEVVYWELLREKLIEINEPVNEGNVDRLLNSLCRDFDEAELMAGNRHLQTLLRRGKKFNAKHGNGTKKPVYVRLIDFDRPDRNSFVAVNQMRFVRGASVRPDVTLLVNGLPLVHMEIKSLAQDNDWTDATSDLRGYEEAVPRLFFPTLLNVAADTQSFRYGAVGAKPGFYFPWSKAPLKYQDENDLKQATQALLNPRTLLDIALNYVFYEEKEGGTAKIVPRHMQYYAVRRLLKRIREGDKKRGLIWHTQGSGKSFAMLYAAKNLLERSVLGSPQIFLIVDTDKLATQMGNTLSAIGFERSVVAKSIDHLQRLIEQGQSQLVLTTIQKFQDVATARQGNDEVVVMADEAHRFMERRLGNNLEAAMPDAYHFGFTGTPVHEGESDVARSTFRNYCPDGEPPLHHYSIRDGIEDEVILPVYFTLRHEAEWDVDEAAMDEAFDLELGHLSEEEKMKVVREALTPTDLGEFDSRIEVYAGEVIDHYEKQVEPNGWKGMVVAPSRKSAALYGTKLRERRPDGDVEVLYTEGDGDEKLLSQFHTTSEERDDIISQFKDEAQPKLLVVHNMLLTGFDAPVLKTMYLDRRLKDHTLLQAIARTNRPADGKTNGEIVDFQGVFENLDDALSYDAETRDFAAQDKDRLFEDFEEQLEKMWSLFEGVPRTDRQEAVSEALATVSKHPQKREFKRGFKRLQDLYESLSPDGRLSEEEVERKYQWLSHIWVAFRRANREPDPEKEVREKTREIVEKHVDVTGVKEDFPIYKVGEEHLEAIEEQEPAAQASSIAHAVKAHVRPRVDQNPRYEALSERVQEVLHQWQTKNMSDPEAVEALREVERDVLDVEATAEEKGLGEAEHALFALLESDYGLPEDGAGPLAKSVADRIETEVDTSYPGWQRNEKARKAIKQEIMRALINEDETDLIKAGFPEEAFSYIIANYTDGQPT
ncbi:type I restriction endonuclease subunit R [Salinibacter ruber]|uniref:type I restriction endonuclease subunit R n=1 Tax=Salinibacter ruber TaxID=146919 RepID=UPI002074838B|nr:type I restriction endonuclease subunit R [Salinibacter ruber]